MLSELLQFFLGLELGFPLHQALSLQLELVLRLSFGAQVPWLESRWCFVDCHLSLVDIVMADPSS